MASWKLNHRKMRQNVDKDVVKISTDLYVI